MNNQILSLILVLVISFTSCKNEKKQEAKTAERTAKTIVKTGFVAAFGDQPSISVGPNNRIDVTFGEKNAIYYSQSVDGADSFSEPVLVGELEGLMLGYSSGPQIAMTSTHTIITAPSKTGDLYTWAKANDSITWSGPYRINDIAKSVGECLSAITATPDGHLFCTWIDTRKEVARVVKIPAKTAHKMESHASKNDNNQDLDKILPNGMTKRELYAQIGDIPQNTKLAFHGAQQGALLWVLLDADEAVLKAENMEEYLKFKEQNEGRKKISGKIYMASSSNNGRTWSKSKLVYQSPDGSVCECCKPSIKSDSKGSVFVMFRNNLNGSRDLHYTKTSDRGETFSMPEKLGTGTWKINGCPMDGGDIVLNDQGDLNTVWQREGELFLANSSRAEQFIGQGKSPSMATSGDKATIVFSNGGTILLTDSDGSTPEKIGEGHFPKAVSLNNSVIYVWVNENGIQYKRI